jgi:cobalt-zinc-cadmium efflux system outer membrane protein
MRMIFLTPLLAAMPAAALAEPLTFDAAIERAARAAPSIQAGAAGVEARRSAAIAAGRLPDPTLDVGLDNFPVSGPPAFSFTRESMTMARIGVEQPFPNPAKRSAQRTRAAADIGMAEGELAVEMQNVRLETALAWIDPLLCTEPAGAARPSDRKASTICRRPCPPGLPRARRAPRKRWSRHSCAPWSTTDAVRSPPRPPKAKARLARFTGDPDPQVAGDPPTLEVDRESLIAGIPELPRLRALDAARSPGPRPTPALPAPTNVPTGG